LNPVYALPKGAYYRHTPPRFLNYPIFLFCHLVSFHFHVFYFFLRLLV